jgi:transposase
MMGEADSQAPMWSYRVNLDERVRKDHPLRRINAVLDSSFVRGQVAHTYGRRGNKSVPPTVILRMMLLLFSDDIKSERELMRIIPERLDYLWFLGYGLDDQVPDHSVLSKARKRWGKEVFVSLFSRVVQQGVQAGLVEGRKIHVDASLVDANACLSSVKPLDKEMLSAIEQTAREQLQKLDEQDDDQAPPPRRVVAAAAQRSASVPRPIGSLAVGPIRMRHWSGKVASRAACAIRAIEPSTMLMRLSPP